MKTIIVIPTYNERENIELLLKGIFELKVPGLEVVVVDDGSPDGTAEVVKSFAARYPVHLIERAAKLGLGSAYIAGFIKALEMGAECVGEMDADFSHDPADIPRLIEAIEEYDMAIGSRKIPGGEIRGWAKHRHWMSNGAMRAARFMLNLKTRDVTAGFRLFKRRVMHQIPFHTITSSGYAFQEEILFHVERGGFRVVEIPVVFTDRVRGVTKLSFSDIMEFFSTLFRLRFK